MRRGEIVAIGPLTAAVEHRTEVILFDVGGRHAGDIGLDDLPDLFFHRHPLEQAGDDGGRKRSEEHTSELQSLMRISYAVFCLKKKNTTTNIYTSYKTRPTHECTVTRL